MTSHPRTRRFGRNRIRVHTTFNAPPDAVWDAISDISSHVVWMADAEAIRFTSPSRSGVGTTFDCDTRVGPFRLTDRMEVTEWEPGRTMAIRHVGLVTGEGAFRLRVRRGGRTRFTWAETLVFPWWMGGPVGGFVGARILRLIWKGNLRRLRAVVEG